MSASSHDFVVTRAAMAGVWSLWSGDKGDVPASLIRPSEAAFRTWRVGTAVNNVRHDAASLLDPV